MRTLDRNKVPLHYAKLIGSEDQTDEYGNITGEKKLIYSVPTQIRAPVSAAKGVVAQELFGLSESYDRVLLADNELYAEMISDVPSNTEPVFVFWIDTDQITKPHNYVADRIAKSLNGTLISVRKVNISA